MKRILNKFLYLLFFGVSGFLTWLLFRLKVEGRDNLPPKGPFIIAANHASFIDPVVIQIAIPLKISWVARKDVYEEWFLRPVHWAFDSIPMNGAVEKALASLEEGKVLGIFPEGTRSNDGRLKDADVGIAILALKSGSPVVPVGVKGSFEAFGRQRRFPRPHPVTVKIGKPFSFEKVTEKIIEDSLLREKRDYVMERIRDLLTA